MRTYRYSMPCLLYGVLRGQSVYYFLTIPTHIPMRLDGSDVDRPGPFCSPTHMQLYVLSCKHVTLQNPYWPNLPSLGSMW